MNILSTSFKKYKAFLFIIPFVGFSVLFYTLSPETIIEYLGVENAYLFIGVLAFLGGVTTFSGIPYHVVLVSLALGGLDPFILGGVTAFAVMAGDATSYYLGTQSRALLSKRMNEWLESLKTLYTNYPRLLPAVFFGYGCLIPFSNDVITIPMGMLGYPFWKVIIPLGLGNLIFNTTLAFLAIHAYEYLEYFF